MADYHGGHSGGHSEPHAQPERGPRRSLVQQAAAASGRGFQGDYSLLSTAGAELWNLGVGKGRPVTVRPFPGRDPQDPRRLDDYRYSSQDNDFGNWLTIVPFAGYFGMKKLSFVLYNPFDPGYDPATNPVVRIWECFKKADKDNSPDFSLWRGWAKSTGKDFAVLKAPERVAFMQCCLVEAWIKDRDRDEYLQKKFMPPRGLSMSDPLVVMRLPKSGWLNLFVELNRRRKGYDGPAENYAQAFEAGDPVSLDKGGFITFYNGYHDPQRRAAKENEERGRGQDTQQAMQSYYCEVAPSYGQLKSAALTGERARGVETKVLPWDQLIRFPSNEEQVRWVANLDSFPGHGGAKLILVALDDLYGHLIPKQVHDAYRPDRSVSRYDDRLADPRDADPRADPRGYGYDGYESRPARREEPRYERYEQAPPPRRERYEDSRPAHERARYEEEPPRRGRPEPRDEAYDEPPPRRGRPAPRDEEPDDGPVGFGALPPDEAPPRRGRPEPRDEAYDEPAPHREPPRREPPRREPERGYSSLDEAAEAPRRGGRSQAREEDLWGRLAEPEGPGGEPGHPPEADPEVGRALSKIQQSRERMRGGRAAE